MCVNGYVHRALGDGAVNITTAPGERDNKPLNSLRVSGRSSCDPVVNKTLFEFY